MHLQELVRMAFIAATAQSDQLKLEGLQTLQVTAVITGSLLTFKYSVITTVFETTRPTDQSSFV